MMTIDERIEKWESLYFFGKKRYGVESSIFSNKALDYLKNNQKVLVLGCGYGRDVLFYSKKFPSAYFNGIESSKIAVQFLKKDITEQCISNINVIQSNVYSIEKVLPENEKYEVIILHYFLHLFLREEQNEILTKIGKFLSKDGIILASYISKNDDKFGKGIKIEDDTYSCYPDRPWHTIRFAECEDLEKLYSLSNLNMLKCFEYLEKELILGKKENTLSIFTAARLNYIR
ncbi:MAG: hypothetical protein POELPBGB_03601 [Bacteroidia bacterium]|nr:hypothetical protein [Bacteroidia bacterium]